MPRYYCDYCDTYLTHDSPSVRKQHNAGYKHKANVRQYYQQFEEEQTQSLIDQKIREHLGQTGGNTQFGLPHFGQSPGPGPYRPPMSMPGLPPPSLPPPGSSSGPPSMRPPVLPLPTGYGGPPSTPNGLPGPPPRPGWMQPQGGGPPPNQPPGGGYGNYPSPGYAPPPGSASSANGGQHSYGQGPPGTASFRPPPSSGNPAPS
eukprot:jgi/Mesen1/352/ME000001S02661